MIAGPLAASMLADMGADVIKIESPGSGDLARNKLPKKDGISNYFVVFNRGQRGITLNLKHPEGWEVLKRMLREADVLIENFRSGVIDQLGNFFEASAPGNTYPTKSGEKVMISTGQANAWPKFAHILGHDEWIDMPEFQRVEDRVKNRLLLDPMIAEETSKFEKNVLLERLAEAKIAAAPVMTVADVANDPHFRDERSMYTEVTHPQLGPVRITNQAVKMSETNPYVRGCAPLLGEHNDEVYQSLGFTPEEISAWREKGVI